MFRTPEGIQHPVLETLEPRLLLDGEIEISVDYLIIAADSLAHNEASLVGELAEWKQLKGFRTKVVDMSYINAFHQDTNKGIKDYIAAGWFHEDEEYWTTPPQYVLLVGDSQQVPSSSGELLNHEGFFHVSDNPYANVVGDSYSPLDLALGRIPVSTVDDVTMAINKILTYDRTPDVPGPEEVNWYTNALVAATYMGQTDGNNEYETGAYFMETAHRAADFLSGDFDYWPDARGSWQSFALAA